MYDKEEETITLSLYNLMILLYHVHKGTTTEGVGFEDAAESLRSLTKILNRDVTVKKSAIESALWSCNLMDEEKKFWHPKSYEFKYFVKVLLRGKGFSRKYNWVKDIGE